MRYRTWSSIGWVAVALLPLAARADSLVQRELRSVLRATPDVNHGRAIFDVCSACHGSNGAGASDGTVPAIAGQHFRVIARELVDYRHGKRWDERMEHFSDRHHLTSTQEIADVASYVSGLQPAHSSEHGTGERVNQGSELYARQCASCHGARAGGDNAKGYPRLAGQHYSYLLGQLQAASEGHRPNFPPQHVRMLQHIGSGEATGLADYLSRLEP